MSEPKVKAVKLTNTVQQTILNKPKVKAIHFVNEVIVTRFASSTTITSTATIY